MLIALRCIENEMYFHESEVCFFAKTGSSINFESNDNGLVKTLVMDNNIRGERKELLGTLLPRKRYLVIVIFFHYIKSEEIEP